MGYKLAVPRRVPRVLSSQPAVSRDGTPGNAAGLRTPAVGAASSRCVYVLLRDTHELSLHLRRLQDKPGAQQLCCPLAAARPSLAQQLWCVHILPAEHRRVRTHWVQGTIRRLCWQRAPCPAWAPLGYGLGVPGRTAAMRVCAALLCSPARRQHAAPCPVRLIYTPPRFWVGCFSPSAGGLVCAL
jgi:hypothetical protein